MCGIAGLLGIDPATARPIAERMRVRLGHRGPDDTGIEVVSQGAARHHPPTLVHTRLSIVDLSPLGRQPMFDEPPEGAGPANCLVYNGEIYNFRSFWSELEAAGFRVRSRSDTEVILHAYRRWGTRAVERFTGMFAWCLVDTTRGLAWFCRDRVGMKPLYLFDVPGGGVLFASEVRTLLAAHEFVEPRLDRGALESYLAQGAVIGERSIVQGIRMLRPGESLLLDLEGRRVSSQCYWTVDFGADSGAVERPADGSVGAAHAAAPVGDRPQLVRELRESLCVAVRQMLLADVPVGLLLSSGVDSSAIATLATEVTTAPLRTVSVGFDVAGFDESVAAEQIAAELGTEHSTIHLDGRAILGTIDRVLDAVDQPSVDGFNTFHAARAAREAGVTVALSGLGGDELFGGYPAFRELPPALRALRALGTQRTRAGLRHALAGTATFMPSSLKGRAVLKMNEVLARPPELVTLYCLRRELLLPHERRLLHELPDGVDAMTGIEQGLLDSLRQSHADRAVVDRVAYLEFSMYMRHMLLRDADVFSMAHPLELRLPLLEHRVVANAARARAAWRRPDPRPKPLLIDAAGPRLPAQVWRRKKHGFALPWESWLRGALERRAASALAEGDTWTSLGLSAPEVSRFWRRFCERDPAIPAVGVLALVVLGDFARRHALRV